MKEAQKDKKWLLCVMSVGLVMAMLCQTSMGEGGPPSTSIECIGGACKGPVAAVFASNDCSGDSHLAIQQIDGINQVQGDVSPGECLALTRESVRYECFTDRIEIRKFYSDDCSGPAQTTTHPLAKCFSFPTLERSFIFLCNASEVIDHGAIAGPDTIAAPVFYVDPVASSKLCPSVGQCTPGVPYATSYSASDCNAGSAIASTEFEQGALTGQCYQNSALAYNYHLQCSANSELALARFPSQCNTTAFSNQTTPTNVCLRSKTDASQWVLYNCGTSGSPTPPPSHTTPTPSPSPVLSPTGNIPPSGEGPTGVSSFLSPQFPLIAALFIAAALFLY